MRLTRCTPYRQRRIETPAIVACIVPSSSMPSAWSWLPTISRSLTVGIRWRCQTRASKVDGSADLAWVPTSRMAGPGPSMSRRAVAPWPSSAIGPTRSRSISSGRRQAVSAARQDEPAAALIDRMPNRLGVVGPAVADGPEVPDVAHGRHPPGADRGTTPNPGPLGSWTRPSR